MMDAKQPLVDTVWALQRYVILLIILFSFIFMALYWWEEIGDH